MTPSFLSAYKKKYSNRKADMLAWFGTVELMLDKRHKIHVCTGHASCLLMVADMVQVSNDDLARLMGSIDPSLLRQLLEPLFDSSVLTEDNGMLKITDAD